MVGSYVGRRFFEGAALSAEEVRTYADYQYQILGQPGSGEHCLNLMMEPIGYPRVPIALTVEALACPVTWIYGVNDWMAPRNGQQCAERRIAAGKPAECVLLDGAGTWASTSFWTISRVSLSPVPSLPRCAACSTWWPCVWNADWCLQSDGVTGFHLQSHPKKNHKKTGHYCFMNNDRGFDAAVLRAMEASDSASDSSAPVVATPRVAGAPTKGPGLDADPAAAAAVPSWLAAAGGAGAGVGDK